MLTEEIHLEALEAAKKATNKYIEKYGDVGACGFSWVKADIKGNTKLGKSFITQGFSKSYNYGYDLWNPAKSCVQSVNALYEGSKAYVEVIRKYLPDVDIYACDRLD